MAAPAELEVFRHALQGIVEEMGVTLQRTAYSTNIKIRRDHTCALFDADLRHVAQHDVAPQHIGTLISMVPELMTEHADELEPGDGFLVNDPYRGRGSIHLPDVALVSPLFDGDEVVGYAANSAHHVDIGGNTPGGIPTDRTSLYGEGLILSGVRGVRDWTYDDQILALITRNVRGADMRLGDYHAQLGANRIGLDRYLELVRTHGRAGLRDRIDELLDYTERRVRAAIAELPDGTYEAADTLDGDGISDEPVRLCLAVTVDGDGMTIDFSGSASQRRGPLNCTPALAFAGVIYSIMALLGEDLPKNDGFYRPFETVTPEGTVVNPRPQAPVAAAAEVAVRAADLVIRAMAPALPDRAVAAGKGTICNIAYGGLDPRSGDEYVYYETVAGGYGARADKDGMEAVQAHFQNTANSPIEELEREIPLHVRRYELVPDSGGPGRRRGGLGVRRDLEFYDHGASFSVLADRATTRPWGLFGGCDGTTARYRLDPDGPAPVELSSKTTVDLRPGGIASIQTPGGGGYGDPLDREPERVLADVVEGKVSPGRARADYGVVVDPASRTVDEAATAALRADRRPAATDAEVDAGPDVDGEDGADRP